MDNDPVVIVGMGHEHPPYKIDNYFFESLDIDSSAQWVEDRTGIKSRYSVLSPDIIRKLRFGEATVAQLRKEGSIPGIETMVEGPWNQALSRSQAVGSAVDLVICGTSIPDYLIPANANVIAAKLNLSCTAFDAQSACSSFVTNLSIAKAMLKDGAARKIGVFNAERYSTYLDFSDRRSCVLFGDGAACAILSREASASGLAVEDVVLHSDPSGFDAVTIPVDGVFKQNGARVQKFAVTKTCEVVDEIMARNSLRSQDVKYFIGHQANFRMLLSASTRLGFTENQHLYNVDTHGNQGAAGAPIVLSSHWDQFEVGDRIVLAVVGSGLTWGAALLRRI
ncbi:MAG: ketoacyl-ACP synthase III [Oligoflexales bacterium]|nr:ketoacyl-ACP synthase III [Oligoflexales bacterium]